MITTTKKSDGSVETKFVGCVVSIEKRSVQVMSDIYEYHTYAMVFNNETGNFEEHFISSDYYPEGQDRRGATVNATDEIKYLFEKEQAVIAAKKALRNAEAAREEALRSVRCPGRGKTLKVVRGRKIAKGTVGECTWYGEGRNYSPYRSSYRGQAAGPMRVGMKVNGEVVYTDASNVEVVVG